MEKYWNYKGARILGMCLNVMGLDLSREVHRPKEYRDLKKFVLCWTRKNYLRMLNDLPEVAAACLMGTITYDPENRRIVKTYSKGLSRVAPQEFLDLDEPAARGPSS
jgi:hypothetical protein